MISGLGTVCAPAAIQREGLSINFWHFGKTYKANRNYFPNGTVLDHAPDDGAPLVVAMYFPRCGLASGDLDSDDHFSHMPWTLNDHTPGWDKTGGGKCPDTHPIMYPGIFIETFYEVSDFMKANWNKNEPNIVVANGDVTGITYHADFVNGWDTQVLQDAINKCASIDSVKARDCKVFKPSIHDHKLCKLEGQIPAEEVGTNGPIDKLPGCNPLWGWDGPAEHVKCKGPEPGYVTPNLDNRIRGTSFASPGANDTELMTRYRSPGLYQYNRWGSFDDRTTLPYIKPSTQEEVNAAANGGNKIAIIPGQVDSSSFTARTPASPPPASFAEGHGDRHINFTYICPDPASEPWHGLPCITPGAGVPAATGTPTGVLLATPQASTASAQDKPAVEVDGAAGGAASSVSTPLSASTTDKPPATATGKPVGTVTGNQPTGINGTGPAKVCQHKRRRRRQH